MKKFVPYRKTEDLKNKWKNTSKWAYHLGTKVSQINLTGTVKVHGTNMGISYWNDKSVNVQTRNELVIPTVTHDTFGMNVYLAQLSPQTVMDMLSPLIGDATGIIMYGEFFGRGIQKGVAVSECNKSFMVFSVVRLYDDVDENGEHCWKREHLPVESIPSIPEKNFYRSCDFKQYNVTFEGVVDRDVLMKHTLEVEENCPVGTTINPECESRIGEGIVWDGEVVLENGERQHILFKTKGDKHKRAAGSAKSKEKPERTPEQNSVVRRFFEVAVTNDRLEQGFEYLNTIGLLHEVKNIGHYIKWVLNDISTEHASDITEILYPVALDWLSVRKEVTETVRNYFLNKI